MELTIGVAVGSSIQIAAGMIPLLVIIAWPMHKNLTLDFTTFETIVLFVSVMLVNLLLQDGKSFFAALSFQIADHNVSRCSRVDAFSSYVQAGESFATTLLLHADIISSRVTRSRLTVCIHSTNYLEGVFRGCSKL